MLPRKVFVIGIDGGTFDVVNPLIQQGKLPNLSRLMDNGAYGNLMSVHFPMSAQAWTSFKTGVNPGKHGVFGFTRHKKNSYELTFTNATDCHAKTIWGILSEVGKQSNIVNIPLTYPPENINGVMISGLDAPGTSSEFVHPPYLKKKILNSVKGYIIDLHAKGLLDTQEKRLALLDEIELMIEKRTELIHYLMDKHPWDLFVAVFAATDQVSHYFWKYLDSTHSKYVKNSPERLQNAIFSVYENIDRQIGTIIERLDEETNIIVVSDHGFCPIRGLVHLNKWLQEEGFLVFKEGYANQANLSPAAVLKTKFYKSARELRSLLLRVLSARMKDILCLLMPGIRAKVGQHIHFNPIDWSKTRAYAGANYGGIRINLKGRQPEGIVEPGEEYESLCTQIIQRLLCLIDEETGEKVFERAFRKSEVYHGKCVEDAPDIILVPQNYEYLLPAGTEETILKREKVSSVSPISDERTKCADHNLEGMFIMSGPDAEANVRIPDASLIDIAPTILHLMGEPIPEDMDGKVIEEALTSDYMKANPITFTSSDDSDIKTTQDDIYSEEDTKKIEEKLKGLGYIE